MRTSLGTSLLLLTVLAAPAAAAPITIDFEQDALGFKGNGFISADSPLVSFTDTSGAELEVGQYGVQTDGRSLLVRHDDASRLQMDFSASFTSIQLSFGNDDPSFLAPGGRAFLELFDNGNSLGITSVAANRDDIMNQTIAFSGGAFNRALFWYGDAAGNPAGLIEIVDNIVLDTVPEPTSLALLAATLTALGIRSRRRTA